MSKNNYNNASPLSVYFVTTEGIGSHYEGHKHGIDELKTQHMFSQK